MITPAPIDEDTILGRQKKDSMAGESGEAGEDEV